MTTTQNNGLLNSASVKTRLAFISDDLEKLRLNHVALGQAVSAVKDAVNLLRGEIQTSDDNAWKAALSGITRPSTNPAPAAAPATSTGYTPQGYANVPATPVTTGKPVNLTEEARKLLHTGHSYEGAIRKLTALHPGREREHIRRAVGRANGGKA